MRCRIPYIKSARHALATLVAGRYGSGPGCPAGALVQSNPLLISAELPV